MVNEFTAKRDPRAEKVKDMIKSILPSTYSKQAFFAKRLERRRVRHLVNANLRTCDQEGYTDKNLQLKPYQRRNVVSRRNGDKLNPFLNWASRLTAGMDDRDALSYISKFLPPSVIGDHAYSHWESEVKYGGRHRKASFSKRRKNEVFLCLGYLLYFKNLVLFEFFVKPSLDAPAPLD
jgi:hypothetical protein